MLPLGLREYCECSLYNIYQLEGADWLLEYSLFFFVGVFTHEEVDAILEEALKLKHFSHQNVLNLIGVCIEGSPAPYIVVPFMANGSLLIYLRKEKMSLVLSNDVDEDIVRGTDILILIHQ